MMQHVPEVALYVPLRLVMYQHEAIVRVSELLDQKLAVLVARAVQTPK